MEHEIKEINEKRDYLHKLIEEKHSNILSEEILKASKKLDKLIYEYYLNRTSSYGSLSFLNKSNK